MVGWERRVGGQWDREDVDGECNRGKVFLGLFSSRIDCVDKVLNLGQGRNRPKNRKL